MRMFTALAALSLATPTVAQDDGLTVIASARARGEAIAGQQRAGRPADDAAIFTRLRVEAEYRQGPITVGGELIDSRAFFERQNSTVSDSEVNALEPMQAWLGVDVAPGTRARAGRFPINLGSRRLVSENNFRNTINSFTGARVDWESDAGRAVAFWAMPHDRLPDDLDGVRDDRIVRDRERTALQLLGAFVQRPLAFASLELYAYRLAERDASGFATRDRRLWTPGARILRAPAAGKVDFELEGAWQFGRARASSAPADRTDRRVAAYVGHAAAGYTFAAAWRPRVSVAFDLASGEGAGDKISRFDPLFGSRSFDFGPTGLLGAISRTNLVSPEARLEVVPSDRWDSYFTARPLWLARATDNYGVSGVRDPTGRSGRYVGLQLDVRARYWITPDRLRLALGATYLDKGHFLLDAPNAPETGDTRYGYIELTFTP